MIRLMIIKKITIEITLLVLLVSSNQDITDKTKYII